MASISISASTIALSEESKVPVITASIRPSWSTRTSFGVRNRKPASRMRMFALEFPESREGVDQRGAGLGLAHGRVRESRQVNEESGEPHVVIVAFPG